MNLARKLAKPQESVFWSRPDFVSRSVKQFQLLTSMNLARKLAKPQESVFWSRPDFVGRSVRGFETL